MAGTWMAAVRRTSEVVLSTDRCRARCSARHRGHTAGVWSEVFVLSEDRDLIPDAVGEVQGGGEGPEGRAEPGQRALGLNALKLDAAAATSAPNLVHCQHQLVCLNVEANSSVLW